MKWLLVKQFRRMDVQSINPQNVLSEVMEKMTKEEKLEMVAQM